MDSIKEVLINIGIIVVTMLLGVVATFFNEISEYKEEIWNFLIEKDNKNGRN